MAAERESRSLLRRWAGWILAVLAAAFLLLQAFPEAAWSAVGVGLSLAFVMGLPMVVLRSLVGDRRDEAVRWLALGLLGALLVALAIREVGFREIAEDSWNWWFSGIVFTFLALSTGGVLALRRGQGRSALIAFAGLLSGGAFFVGFASSLPPYERVMGEDGWGEWATFYAFLLAGLLAGALAWREWRRPTPRPVDWIGRVLGCGVLVFCLLVAGEEISWGQRLLGFEPPEIFLARNYQQEANVHNFFKNRSIGQLSLDTRFLVIYVCLIYGMLVPVSWRIIAAPRESRKSLGPSLTLLPWFALVALAELVYPINLTGEGAELFLGYLFLVDGFRQWGESASPRRHGIAAIVLFTAPLWLGGSTPRLVDAVLYRDRAALEATARWELDALRHDMEIEGVLRRARFEEMDGVHRRFYSAVERGYMSFGRRSRFLDGRPTPAEGASAAARNDRKGYFLDPWNDPYWVRYDYRHDAILVYSFGPNRRRDTDFDHLPGTAWRQAALEGDDLGVAIELGTREDPFE